MNGYIEMIKRVNRAMLISQGHTFDPKTGYHEVGCKKCIEDRKEKCPEPWRKKTND